MKKKIVYFSLSLAVLSAVSLLNPSKSLAEGTSIMSFKGKVEMRKHGQGSFQSLSKLGIIEGSAIDDDDQFRVEREASVTILCNGTDPKNLTPGKTHKVSDVCPQKQQSIVRPEGNYSNETSVYNPAPAPIRGMW